MLLIGQADVVEYVVELGRAESSAGCSAPPDREAGCVFNAGARFGPHMEDELPAVGVREEVLAEKRNEAKAQQARSRKAGNKDLSQRNKPSEQR